MYELLHHPDLMLFHFSLLTLVILSMVETLGYFFKSRPSHFLKRLSPQKLTESPLLDVKFSKVLIVVFLLLNFSVAGYFLQFCIYAKEQTFTSAYYLILPALIIAIFFTVFMIHCWIKLLNPDQIKNKPTYWVVWRPSPAGMHAPVFRLKLAFAMNTANSTMYKLSLSLVSLSFSHKLFSFV